MQAKGTRMDGNSFTLKGGYIASTQHEHFTNLVVSDSIEDLKAGKVIAGIHGAVEFRIIEDQN